MRVEEDGQLWGPPSAFTLGFIYLCHMPFAWSFRSPVSRASLDVTVEKLVLKGSPLLSPLALLLSLGASQPHPTIQQHTSEG